MDTQWYNTNKHIKPIKIVGNNAEESLWQKYMAV